MNYMKYMKKNILIIIIFLIAVTLLAVLWLNNNNNNNKEGLEFTEKDAADFGNDLQSYASEKLAQRGIIIPKDITANATKFIADLSKMMNADINNNNSSAASYKSGATIDIDTTLSPCNKLKSFFFGNNFSDSFCQVNGN